MGVHCDLKAWPEQHVGAIDVAVCGRDFPALQLECRVLVQSDAEQDAEAIVGGFDQLFCEGAAEGEGRFEDGGEALGYLVVGIGGEKFGQKRVFGGGVVD